MPNTSPSPSPRANPEGLRIVAYYNANTHPVLAQAATFPYSHYILSFLVPDGETKLEPSAALGVALADRSALAAIRTAGKKIMVSVGGAGLRPEDWLAFGKNAEAVADSIATLVEAHELDGVDLDIEAVPFVRRTDFEPYAEAAIELTLALAARLPDKLLTHAPQPPYLCKPGSAGCLSGDSLYADILAGTGDAISWLNMQYYNNPPVSSSTSEQVASYRAIVEGWSGFPGLEPERLVLGKPYSPRVSGFEDRETLLSQVIRPLLAEFGPRFGGFMAWEYSEDPHGKWAEAMAGAFRAATVSSDGTDDGTGSGSDPATGPAR